MLVPCTNCKNSFDPKLGRCLVCRTAVDPESNELRVALVEEAKEICDDGVPLDRVLEDYKARYGLPDEVIARISKDLNTHLMEREAERYGTRKADMLDGSDGLYSLWTGLVRLFGFGS